jgi:ammonia channel protein AmtB
VEQSVVEAVSAGAPATQASLLELKYAALDTFYILVTGALVMWMAAGLVRAKSTIEILTKNIALYSIACILYMLMGYNVMSPGEAVNSGWPRIGFLLGSDNSVESVVAGGDDAPYYSNLSDFFFQVVFVATAMSIVSAAFLVWSVIKLIMGIRISEQEEYEGADLSEFGMEAYPEFVGSAGSGK